jgi:hypothetical protein
MRSNNNGSPEVCANNLLQITRGEVPYDRIKGIGVEHFDEPASQAVDSIADDAEWLIGVYEPRAAVDGVEVTTDDAATGRFKIKANINTNKEAE